MEKNFENLSPSLELQIFINRGFWRETMEIFCFALEDYNLKGELGFKKF